MKWFRWALPVVLVAAIGAVIWGNFSRSRAASGSLTVRTAPVQQGDVVAEVSAPGTIAALQDAVVRARVSAPVTDILVREGDRVKAGQVLVKLDDRDLVAAVAQAQQAAAQAESALAALERRAALVPQQSQQALASAELSLRQAEASLSQQQQEARDRLQKALLDLSGLRAREAGTVPPDQFSRDLQAAMLAVQQAETDLRNLEPDAATPAAPVFALQSARMALEKAQLDAGSNQVLPEERAAAQSALDSARQALDLARSRLADAAITAPFDGVVLSLPIKVGDVMAPGTPVLTLGTVDTVLALIRVDEVDVGAVAPGQSVNLSATAYPGVTFSGKVRDVAPQASAAPPGQAGAAATFEVRAEVDNQGGKLKPGMNVDTQIITKEAHGVLTVGVESLTERGGKRYVYVVEGDTVHEREVSTGVRSRTLVEVTGGLKAGDQVVTGPYDALKKLNEGMKVSVEAAPAPARS